MIHIGWMVRGLRLLASIRLTIFYLVGLAIGAALSYDNPEDVSIWVLVIPLALLATNLLAAILSNPRINRRPGLCIFHLGLLGIVVLAAYGRLTHLDARVELVVGEPFSADNVFELRPGPWHQNRLDQVHFVQGPYTVDYSANLVRGLTHSTLYLADKTVDVGDDRPLVQNGYRFYTSFNKGFAPILTWTDLKGHSIQGAVHMPAYPIYEYKQAQHWAPPGTTLDIGLWLRLKTAMDQKKAWVLSREGSTGILVVDAEGRRVELRPGETVHLKEGSLRYDELRMWMGYKIFYDPTLHALFFCAMLAVAGLGAHFWRYFGIHPKALQQRRL
ncbi:MAG: hypothetical protein D6698_08445 [Gammaproteobacteria bacterium]|nr:MAG: hypothetical protein D6698_08445 [Gammaproteobacteria bacterium]